MAKCSKESVRGRSRRITNVTFEDQTLTRFGGLAVLQDWLVNTRFRDRLGAALRGIPDATSFGYPLLFMTLVVHYLLGYRRLQEVGDYADDPMIARTLGARAVPSVSTLSRLGRAPAAMVDRLREFVRTGVTERLRQAGLRTVTLDFDGTVQSTRRHAEGTAVGYNSRRKGERSYYPLLCTVAQTGQVFDVLHRPGNVHDSRGASDFIGACLGELRAGLGHRPRLEARLDTAFCAPDILDTLDDHGVGFTVSMHFTRTPAIRDAVERRRRWHRLDAGSDYFEVPRTLRPASWRQAWRVIVIRQRVRRRHKGPLQLDLFEPTSTDFFFKAIVTNRKGKPASVVTFHEGRGEQEALIGELKNHCGLDAIPARRLVANQIHLLAGITAHNTARELQIDTSQAKAANTVNRSSLWFFHELGTLRRHLFWQAGRLIRPNGRLTLALADNEFMKQNFLRMREALAR